MTASSPAPARGLRFEPFRALRPSADGADLARLLCPPYDVIDAAERARLLETLGADAAARTQPPHVRSQVAALEREQKTRATRFARDVVDRSLVDLLSVYRDALILHSGAALGLVNQDSLPIVQGVARSMSAEQLLQAMDAIGTARERIGLNVAPLLALEAMAISLQLPR